MDQMKASVRLSVVVAGAAVAAVMLAGCSGTGSAAEAKVGVKEKAVQGAQVAFDSASSQFCSASKAYIEALDRYGDVLHGTATTVGDVRSGGKDLVAPQEEAFAGAEAAVQAQQELIQAQQQLADAQAAAAAASSVSPTTSPTPVPTATPLAPAATVQRVRQAESDFADTLSGISDTTPLKDAGEQFNSAVVAVEMAWLTLYDDAGCLTGEPQKQAVAAASDYTTALQKDLATAGYYDGEIDGVYGPSTVDAVKAVQKSAGLPITGTMDKATSAALQKDLAAKGGAEAQDSLASTAAVQQTLKLLGFWDGPVDGAWTPELTTAVKKFQTALGVEPTGEVDAATVSAFKKAVAEHSSPGASPTPSASPTATP